MKTILNNTKNYILITQFSIMKGNMKQTLNLYIIAHIYYYDG